MYLHNRNTGTDFYDIVSANRSRFPGGIVHSFTGTQEELEQCLKLDFYIGVNGCSLKSEENCKVRLTIEVDRG
jgi:TatD DNase family protein